VSELPVVLAVDDRPLNLELVQAYLSELDCEVVTADNGHDAVLMVQHQRVDLLLLDVMMPGIDGFEVCRRIKADPKTRLLPVVLVTALNQVPDRVRGLEVGADDFIAKPVDRFELVARVRSLLRVKALYDRLDDAQRVMLALARAVEAKDAHTESHTERVGQAARALGEAAGITGEALEDLYFGGVVHDIGKIGVPDAVLGKAGPLTENEIIVMRQHVILGEQIVAPLRSAAGLAPIVRHHHERWDGTGYPDRLLGERIPLEARIVAICDAFDAMVNQRPYRAALGEEHALKNLADGAASQWDPALVELFVAMRRNRQQKFTIVTVA
jgi:putative two-component system response regulator